MLCQLSYSGLANFFNDPVYMLDFEFVILEITVTETQIEQIVVTIVN